MVMVKSGYNKIINENHLMRTRTENTMARAKKRKENVFCARSLEIGKINVHSSQKQQSTYKRIKKVNKIKTIKIKLQSQNLKRKLKKRIKK